MTNDAPTPRRGQDLLTTASSAARQRVLLEHASDGLVLLDRNGEVLEVGPSYPQVMGYDVERRRAIGTAALIHPEDLDRWQQVWSQLVDRGADRTTVTLRARHARGEWCWVEVTLVNHLADPAVGGVVAAIRTLPTHPDRHRVMARLSEALGQRGRYGQVLVLVVRLDQLDLVARACGQRAGDDLVLAVLGRLRTTLRDQDEVELIDQDRFVVICQSHGGSRAAEAVADRIAETLSEPFHIDGDQVVLTASIGIAVGHNTKADAGTLLADADLAMAAAAAQGGNRWSVYSSAERAGALRAVTLPAALRHALDDAQFVVHYQPVMDLGTGTTAGMEALVRWAQPDGTLADPDSFISVAEDSGVIVALGAWVLRQACRTAVGWRTEPEAPPYVAVNLSGRQLEDPQLPEIVKTALADTGIEPCRLVLEVTESVLLRDQEVVHRRLQVLRKLGVRVAVDDFGTGYSSLASLKRLPVDLLKIDRSFVAGLGVDRGDAAIVSAVLTLAEAFGLDIVAEGVETETQAAELRRLGCRYAQGFLYGRPGPSHRAAPPARHRRRRRGSTPAASPSAPEEAPPTGGCR